MPSNMDPVWINSEFSIENEIWWTFLIGKCVGNDWFMAIITMWAFSKNEKICTQLCLSLRNYVRMRAIIFFHEIIKNKLRSRRSDSSLKNCLLLSVTNLTPSIRLLVWWKKSRVKSHIKAICLFCLCIKLFYSNRKSCSYITISSFWSKMINQN